MNDWTYRDAVESAGGATVPDFVPDGDVTFVVESVTAKRDGAFVLLGVVGPDGEPVRALGFPIRLTLPVVGVLAGVAPGDVLRLTRVAP